MWFHRVINMLVAAIDGSKLQVIAFGKQGKRQVNFRNRVSNEMNFNALQ